MIGIRVREITRSRVNFLIIIHFVIILAHGNFVQ